MRKQAGDPTIVSVRGGLPTLPQKGDIIFNEATNSGFPEFEAEMDV